MKKTYLTKYTSPQYQALNSGGIVFYWHLKTVWFGIIKTHRIERVVIHDSAPFKKTLERWDLAVKYQHPLI